MKKLLILLFSLLILPFSGHASDTHQIKCTAEENNFQLNFNLSQHNQTLKFVDSYNPKTKKHYVSDTFLLIVEWINGPGGLVQEIWAIDDVKNAKYKEMYGTSLSTYYFNLEKKIYLSNRTYPNQSEANRFQGKVHNCYF